MNFLFTLAELQRLVRAYADKQAARYGITRAQWRCWPRWSARGPEAVGTRRTDGMQPITLTRLIDKLCDNAGSNAAATRPIAASTGLSAQAAGPARQNWAGCAPN